MAMTPKERATLAGRARANSQTPEQRSALARKAYVASIVTAAIKVASDLTPEQAALMNAVYGEVKHNDR
jgi:hypothetical protein